jgi:hypothetical protein
MRKSVNYYQVGLALRLHVFHAQPRQLAPVRGDDRKHHLHG